MIEINNLTAVAVDEDFLKEVAKNVLKGEKKKETGVSIVLVGQEKIKKLNKKYRGKNKTTDVLSFGNGLNEIVICLREVKKNAKRYKSTFKKELGRVLIHGILHLFGYDHEKSESESKKMQEKEEYYGKVIHY